MIARIARGTHKEQHAHPHTAQTCTNGMDAHIDSTTQTNTPFYVDTAFTSHWRPRGVRQRQLCISMNLPSACARARMTGEQGPFSTAGLSLFSLHRTPFLNHPRVFKLS